MPKKVENFNFYGKITTCKASSNLVDLNHALINFQWSNRPFGASLDFSLFPSGSVFEKSFAKAQSIQVLPSFIKRKFWKWLDCFFHRLVEPCQTKKQYRRSGKYSEFFWDFFGTTDSRNRPSLSVYEDFVYLNGFYNG